MNIIIKNPFSTDIITNSSSVVYSMATSVDSFHDFIDEILRHFGTGKNSRDVFDIIVLPDLGKLEYIDEYLDNGSLDELDLGKIKERFGDIFNEPYSRDKRKRVLAIAIELVKEGIIPVDVFDNGYYQNSSYLVSLKDGSETNIGNMIEELFSLEASYDG